MLLSLFIVILFTFSFVLIAFAMAASDINSDLNSDYKTKSLAYKHYEYHIPYKILDSDIQEMKLDCTSMSLLIHMQKTMKEENLTINIPRMMLDTKFTSNDQSNGIDTFIILVNGIEVEYEENSNTDFRIVDIPLNANATTIEVLSSTTLSSSYIQICGMSDMEKSSYYKLLEPLKQLKNGVLAGDILCKEGLELIIKSSNDSPVCVTSETKSKLFERGWAKPI